MATRWAGIQFDKKAIRDWTLYVVRFTDSHYYVGITSRRNYMDRINEHGGQYGAKVNQGKALDQVIEIRHIGRMSGERAGNIENDVTLEYRKKFGARKVRGGYDIYKKTSFIPTYTPGSQQWLIFMIVCLLIGGGIFVILLSGVLLGANH